MSAINRELSERDAKIDALVCEVEQLRAWQRARLETDDAGRKERDALVNALALAETHFQSMANVFREEGFAKIAALADDYREEVTTLAVVGGPTGKRT